MMWNHNFTMMNEDEDTADPVGTVLRPSTTTMPSKRMMRTTGRSFGRRMVRAGAGLLLLLLVAEGAVMVPEEAAAEGAGWSNPVSSFPGRQGRVVGADRASKAAVADEGVVMTEDGHDTTTSRRYDFAAAAGADAVVPEDGSRLYEFPLRHETVAATAEEEDGIVMAEDGSRTHEFSTPRRVNVKNSKKTSPSLAEQSELSGKRFYPSMKTLYLVRHANKIDGDHDAYLCKAGVTRAQGLVKLFTGYKNKYTDHIRAVPDHLFAHMYAKPPYNVQRCLETLGPIAKALEKTKGDPKYIHRVDLKDQNKKGADKIHELLKSTGGHVVLAAWEHVNIPKIVPYLFASEHHKQTLKNTGKYIPCTHSVTPGNTKPEFPGNDDFDYVYTFEYGNATAPHHPTRVTCHHQDIPISCKDFDHCAYKPKHCK